MRVEVEILAGVAVVTAGGRLTTSEAPRLHRALLEAFAASGPVRLVLRDVQEPDLTLLQLVCSAQRTARERGVPFVLEGADREPLVLRLIRDAGAAAGVGCAGECAWAAAGACAPAGEPGR